MGKVVSLEEILRERPQWSAKGKRIVFLAGCFDLLHPGHIRLLEHARDIGDVVCIAVFSGDGAEDPTKNKPDARNRPVAPANERAEVLAALSAVDFAFEIDPRALGGFLAQFRPDAIVDGAHLSSSPTLLSDCATQLGLKVTRIPLEPGHSSSRLIERITQLRA